jgi:tetratricopeptide (TPR) repeat protein
MTRKRELEEAQRYFEEATQRAPGLIEARLRLGNVLAKVGPSGEAADHLRRATQDDAEPLLQYYAHLILGQMLTALGDRANAVLAYEKAGRIMPLARLPNLALAAAAARAGDDDARRRLLSRALSADLDDQAEPWFSYSQSAGRHAGELLDSLRKSVAETRR